jgi:hypothetical protein
MPKNTFFITTDKALSKRAFSQPRCILAENIFTKTETRVRLAEFKKAVFYVDFSWYMFDHPASVCMTYLEHAHFSFSIGIKLLIGAYKAFVHAACPDWFVTSTSDLLHSLQEDMAKVGCRDHKIKES